MPSTGDSKKVSITLSAILATIDRTAVLQSLADAMNINVNRIINVVFSEGSVKIEFQVSDDGTEFITADDAVFNLKVRHSGWCWLVGCWLVGRLACWLVGWLADGRF